ncbi:MAG: hypothetical protein P1V51_00045 [Deltaproteobacteria bacterium]|nr:hypothetical protein [Deltaproteobacteria bacterium]
MDAITKPGKKQAERISLTLAGESETLEREVEAIDLDTLKIWDLQLAPAQRLVGILRFPDGTSEWIRGEVVFAGKSSGREFSTLTMRPETWEGFIALVRHRAAGVVELAPAA